MWNLDKRVVVIQITDQRITWFVHIIYYRSFLFYLGVLAVRLLFPMGGTLHSEDYIQVHYSV